MVDEFQKGSVAFTLKETATEFVIALEPRGETLPVLNRGMFSLTLRGRPSLEEAQELAAYLQEHFDGLMFLPGTAHIVHGDFDN